MIRTDPIEKVLAEAIGVLDDVLAEATAGIDELLAEAADGIDELLEAQHGIDALGDTGEADEWPTDADIAELGEITKFLDSGGSYATK